LSFARGRRDSVTGYYVELIRGKIGVNLRRNQFRKLMIIIAPTYAQISIVKIILKLKLNYVKLKL